MKSIEDITSFDVILKLVDHMHLVRRALADWMTQPVLARVTVMRNHFLANLREPRHDSKKYHFTARGFSMLEYLVEHLKQSAMDDAAAKAAAIITLKLTRHGQEVGESDLASECVDEMDTFVRIIMGDFRDENDAKTCCELVRETRKKLKPEINRAILRLSRNSAKPMREIMLRLLLKYDKTP